MKNLVTYYTWYGNTEVIAKELHRLVGGDLKRLDEVQQRKEGAGFMGAAFSALIGRKSRLKQPWDPSLSGYDNIFLGAQVWASHSTPAINTFLSKADFSGKTVYLFLSKADDKIPQNVIDSITKRIEKRGGKVADSISITTKMGSLITAEEVRAPIGEFVRKHAVSQSEASFS